VVITVRSLRAFAFGKARFGANQVVQFNEMLIAAAIPIVVSAAAAAAGSR
jgi:hypothetical protein